MSTMRVSVVIVTWNGRDYIGPCLDALVRQRETPSFEIVVVDNGSTDGTPDLVAARTPAPRLIRSERNLGFPAGNNLGIRAAGGQIVVLLNQDTVVDPGWLAALTRGMAESPGTGIAGCRIRFPDGRLQHAGGRLARPEATPFHLGHGETERGQYGEATEAEFVTGAAMALRREMLDEIGLLDEGFFLYYEDTDLCYRARAAGYGVRYLPDATLVHHESASGQRESERYYRRIHTSRWRFMLKHFDLERVAGDALASDRNWLEYCTPPERRGLAAAYSATLDGLDEIWRARATVPGRDAPPADRAAVAEALAAQQAALIEQMRRWQEITERPFSSQTRWVGPLIARGREAWNSVSTKWYTRPLIEQQNVFNRLGVQHLEMAAARQAQQERRLRVLTARVEALEARLAALEPAPPGHEKESDE